jgi:hypothetical protein
MRAQSANITGVVADSANKAPVAGVIIQLLDADGKVLSYTFSDNSGKFSLPYSVRGSVLAFKSMGYRSRTVPVSGNQSPREILLVNEPVQLRDIVVKAPDILLKGDTLVYNVQKYADAQDRTIADVLKKMPGIEVAESGQIKYNGTPINKFYIEGNDLLEGRYGLASNNISHSDVQNVEIMENHQPVRALQGIDYSDQAGLNLRLKESAKLRWSGIVTGGAGFSPLLYDASLFAMRIAGKRQSMETARINNTGWNPASQSIRHTFDNLLSGTAFNQNLLPDYITAGNASAPIDGSRTRFNRSHLFNTTNSVKLKNDCDLKASITYERDALDFTRGAYTDYFDASLSPLTEAEYLQTRKHTLSPRFTLLVNKPEMYLKNNLHADLGWNDATSAITGSYRIGQRAKKPVFDVANELQAVKRIRNRILTVSSNNRISGKPHSLQVENGDRRYLQDVTALAFQSVTEASYGWIFGQWQVRGRAGLDYSHRELESVLTGINDMDGFPVTNDSRLDVTNLYARPEIVYENQRLRLNPYATVGYYAYRFNAKKPEEHLSKSFGIISPALSVRYKFTARLEMFANVRYFVTPPNPDIFYRGVIMNNYRELNAGYPSYSPDAGSSLALSMRYRNPVSAVFANAGFQYRNSRYALTGEQLFINDRILTAYIPASNSGEVYSFNGGLSKGIFSGKIYVGIDAGYVRTKTVSMRNSILIPYQLDALSATPRIKGTVSKWMTAEYSLLAGLNAMSFTADYAGSSYFSLRQKLDVSFFPVKKIRIHAGAEHYRTRFNDNTADNLLLLDAGAGWRISEKIDLNLSATNLMNDDAYRYSRHETLSETVYSYRIRPRNVIMSVQLKF